MKVGDRKIVRIESVAFGGDGIARVDAFVLFVPFSAPDDLAEIEIVTMKKRFGRARLVSVLEPSPSRTEPRCADYGHCGGCCYQHIAYDAELAIKQKQVADAFVKIAGLTNPPVCSIVPSPEDYGYRGKAVLHVHSAGGRPPIWGFMDVSGGRIADIARCEIVHESINDQIARLRRGQGGRPETGDIILWSGDAGTGPVLRDVKGATFALPRDGFFQNNVYLTGRMVDEVLRLAGSPRFRTVVDACCGVGLFSLFIAPFARRVIGVEISQEAVDFARRNAAERGVHNAEFVAGDIARVLESDLIAKAGDIDLVLIDPPRAGLSAGAIDGLIRLHPPEMIYISCNPASLARDTAKLAGAGYQLSDLVGLDMFPQTQHIELISRFIDPASAAASSGPLDAGLLPSE
ncbi:MAG TPA: class I SAM-dependent RNA methyltransferase [Smithellaceae bacterium]|nr:class I SAM-dependent RNA methyltransferase [Smithellaceae bacterium]